MNFLFPTFLWGLVAGAIPIIIHLFNFRRTKKVFFSNVALLKVVETTTSSFRKLKQWLILACRVLFIFCLVIAFAQPFYNNNGKQVKNIGVNSLYIDNSMSMQNTKDNKQYLDLAVIKIDELLSIFQRSSNVQLITNDFSGDDQGITNATKVKDRLTSIGFSSTPRSLESVYNRQKSLLQKYNANANNQLYWFSDFQKSTCGDLKKIKPDSLFQINIVPIQTKASQNVYVDSVWLASPFIREMQNNVVYVKLSNSGEKAVEKMPIKLYLDEAQTSTVAINMAPNSTVITTFNFTINNKGYHRGKITFDDQPINFDNEYYFVLDASPQIQVLQLYQQRSTTDYIAKIFDNDSLFSLKSFNVLNVDVGMFKKANLIVLEGVESISESLKRNLNDFVRQGGSLLIFPSAKPNSATYQSFLGAFGVSNVSVNTQAPLAENRIAIAEPDKNNPFFADVFERTNSIQGALSTPNEQPVLLWKGLGEKVLVYKNNQNFISKLSLNSGKVYLCSSPLDASFGNFAEHAFFVPTMFKIASLSLKQEQTAYSLSNGHISLSLIDATHKEAIYKLKNIQNPKIELSPAQRIVGNNLQMELPKGIQLAGNQPLSPGFYELQLEGITKKIIALNHDNEESQMKFYSPEELKSVFKGNKNVQVFNDIQEGDFIKTFQNQNAGKALWKYFLIAALGFLLAEIMLIRLMKIDKTG